MEGGGNTPLLQKRKENCNCQFATKLHSFYFRWKVSLTMTRNFESPDFMIIPRFKPAGIN